MPVDRTRRTTTRRRRRTLFGVWFAVFAFTALGVGAASGVADKGGNGANNANGNPGHTPYQNHGGQQQGQQYPTPNGGRGIPGCGPSDSQPKKCHGQQQQQPTPNTPGTPGSPGAQGPQGAPGTPAQQGVLGQRQSGGGGGSPNGSNGVSPATGNNAAAQPARAVKRAAAFTG